MTIEHHPSDATLAAYASGTLDQARGLVVATHVSLCAQCRAAVKKFESVGGVVLAEGDGLRLQGGELEGERGLRHGAQVSPRGRGSGRGAARI